jgi:hypothetical protein
MKKHWYILAGVLMVSAMSCKGQPESKNNNTVVAANEVSAAVTDSKPVDQAPLHINRADFIRLVMDF